MRLAEPPKSEYYRQGNHSGCEILLAVEEGHEANALATEIHHLEYSLDHCKWNWLLFYLAALSALNQ